MQRTLAVLSWFDRGFETVFEILDENLRGEIYKRIRLLTILPTIAMIRHEQMQYGLTSFRYPPFPLVLTLFVSMTRVLLAIRFIRQKTVGEFN
ncbi:unnamed protein product [Adineta steineri]|uniref:Uncharacterized protein n=1 Tax=Adineta steineri TaxID=433720 RepID=A0A819YX70_9BILA|nr:unnamed protein product [Adineta steineri]CAF4162341.1 unnamed protein product [Adineta steineri]